MRVRPWSCHQVVLEISFAAVEDQINAVINLGIGDAGVCRHVGMPFRGIIPQEVIDLTTKRLDALQLASKGSYKINPQSIYSTSRRPCARGARIQENPCSQSQSHTAPIEKSDVICLTGNEINPRCRLPFVPFKGEGEVLIKATAHLPVALSFGDQLWRQLSAAGQC